jgi:tetratricopeptide (TPR) repeat protein
VEGLTRSRRLAEQALALDPNLAEAHVSLGLVQSSFWDWEASMRSLERGLELDPQYVFGHQALAGRLAYLGRYDEALEQALIAEQLDPLGVNPGRETTLGWIYWLRGEDEQAFAAFQADLELEPGDPITHEHVGVAHCEAGRFEPGIASLERAAELSPGDALITASLGHCYARAGRVDQARELLEDLERRAELSYISPMAIALIYVGLDDREAAFAWLERGVELRALSLGYIGTDVRWYPLADDPRYDDVVERMHLSPQRERIAKWRG